MLTIRELIKTLYNAFNQKLKSHRGNWEQNDPTADDYIKNRPFYTDGYTKIIKEITFTTPESYYWCSPFVFEPKEGETYKVLWNSKEYECVAKVDPEGPTYIGNLGMIGEDVNTGEPFFFFYFDYGGGDIEYACVVQASGTHTVSISKLNVVKIDKKYIPDDLILDLAPVATSGSYNDLSNTPTIYSEVVRYDTSQSLTETQKTQARTNIGTIAIKDLTTVATSGDYNDLKNLPCSEIHTYSDWSVLENVYSGSTASPTHNYFERWQIRYQIDLDNEKRAWKMYNNNSTIYFVTDYTTGKKFPGSTNYFWGNASFYDSSYENTGENWCLYVATYDQYNASHLVGCHIQDIEYYSNINLSTSLIQSTTVTVLDEKFIPNTIARVSELSMTHEWNGTILTVTSASGTSSADLKGSTGENGNAIYTTTTFINVTNPETGEYEIQISDINVPLNRFLMVGDLVISTFAYELYKVKRIDSAYCEIDKLGSLKGADGANGSNGATASEVIAAMSKETWTFTLTDGTTVTKTVPLI